MNKTLSKAIMNRSRLRNRFIKNPNETNQYNYKRQRNYVVNLLRREKKKYYENLDPHKILDTKTFWKTVKPLFSDKNNMNGRITLIDQDDIISDDAKIAEIMNNFFTNIVENLDIQGYNCNYRGDRNSDQISRIIDKFKDHPSILNIKERIYINEKISLVEISENDITTVIDNLNTRKPTTFNNIPAKLIKENCDICTPHLCKIFNNSIISKTFPDNLKMADIIPGHKKDEKTKKENYRPISILPTVSKIFERILYNQINAHMTEYLSPFLCGFRAGYSTQYCLLLMLEKWKKALDKKNLVGALITDLSKAFDCLNHELLIAKMEAYGFNKESLFYISSYLSGRKQRTKVNNSFSNWSEITSGVPQGSILGPLLFNIYLNDIFLFVDENCLANYADDNTPYAMDKDKSTVLNTILNDTNTLDSWFMNNYLLLNYDKCNLLVTNHDEDVSITLGNEIITGKKWVKLLGVKVDSKLDFTEHVSSICKKVSLKLHALARISKFMSKDKLRILTKAFVESQFGYCPLIWMFHNRTLNNKINKLHERALRLVYNDQKSTFKDLLNMDQSFTIHERNLQKLAIEMYKVKNNLSPSFMKTIFPLSNNPYHLRNRQIYETENIRTVSYGIETISYRGPKTWALVPDKIKNSTNLLEFKTKIKQWKPQGCSCRLCKVYIANLGFI